MSIKYLRVRIFLIFAIVISFSMNKNVVNAKDAKIALSKNKISILVDQKYNLSLQGINNSPKGITWKSSNKNVVKIVKTKGNIVKIQALKQGRVKITATWKKKKYKCTVIVKKPYLSDTKIITSIGKPNELVMNVANITSSKVVSYSSLKNLKASKKVLYWAIQKKDDTSIKLENKNKVKIVCNKIGSTIVAVKYNGKILKCVIKTEEKKTSISEKYIPVLKGNSFELKINGLDSMDPVKWTIENPSVLRKDKEQGYLAKFTGVKTGLVRVVAKYGQKQYDFLVDVRARKNIPSYWEGEITKSINTFQKNAGSSNNMASFLFVTDPHWGTNAKNSPDIIADLYQRLNLPFIVMGGDIINNSYKTKQEGIDDIKNYYTLFSMPILSTTGNHDYNYYVNPSAKLSDIDLYPLMYEREEKYATVAWNGNCASKDDISKKVRYIFFNYYGEIYPSENILNWINEKVMELERDWTVVLISHGYYAPTLGTDPSIVKDCSKKLSQYFLELDEKAESDIAVWMTGHSHRDTHEYLKSGDNQILLTTTNCDSYQQGKDWGGRMMERYTDTEQCIELVQLDIEHKKLYLTRVGAGQGGLNDPAADPTGDRILPW